jgi:hypothetical protein
MVMKEDTLVKQISSLPSSDSEEQRKIAEGADALLNLAGICTRKRMQSTAHYPPGKEIVELLSVACLQETLLYCVVDVLVLTSCNVAA